jgi:hypothetical protein
MLFELYIFTLYSENLSTELKNLILILHFKLHILNVNKNIQKLIN